LLHRSRFRYESLALVSACTVRPLYLKPLPVRKSGIRRGSISIAVNTRHAPGPQQSDLCP
jgi:hypothetical protein